jgi:hypothetical protein
VPNIWTDTHKPYSKYWKYYKNPRTTLLHPVRLHCWGTSFFLSGIGGIRREVHFYLCQLRCCSDIRADLRAKSWRKHHECLICFERYAETGLHAPLTITPCGWHEELLDDSDEEAFALFAGRVSRARFSNMPRNMALVAC